MVERRPRRGPLEIRRLRTSPRVDFLLDQVHYFTALFAKSYFRNDPLQEFETLDLEQVLRDHPPRFSPERETGWKVTVRAGNSRRTARLHWRRPPVPGRPLLVHHPGACSIPYDKVFDRVLPHGHLPGWNIGVIQPAAHRSARDYFRNAFDSLLHLQLLFASSIHAFESCSRWAVRNGAPFIAYSGISIGGLIVSLHMACFGSASLYLPMLAGPDAHHLFFEGSNRPLAHRSRERGRMECYRRALDFTALLASATRRPCYPLLARHDRLMDYRRAARAWKGYPVTTIERGHSTGVFSYQALSEHLVKHLPAE